MFSKNLIMGSNIDMTDRNLSFYLVQSPLVNMTGDTEVNYMTEINKI